MVTVLPAFDPGKEIGESLGSGFGEALKFLGERKMQQNALDGLKGLDLQNMTPLELFAEVGKATAGSPQLQRVAPEFYRTLMDQKRADAARKSYQEQARGLDNTRQSEPLPADQFMDQSPKFGQPIQGQQVSDEAQPFQQRGLQTPQDMRRVPQFEDTTGREALATPQEIAQVTEPFLAIGDTAGAEKARQNLMSQKLKQRELQIQDQKERNRMLEQQRALESELAQNVLNKTDKLLESKGLSGGEQWKRLAYNYFENERSNPDNAKKSDQSLWQSAGAKLERKINDLGDASAKVLRPTLRMNKERRAQGTKKWVQSHLNEYGNTPEDIELMNSVLMGSGWSRHESHAMTRPLSKEATSVYGNIPKLNQPNEFFRFGGELEKKEDAKNFQKAKEQLAPKLAKSLGDNDSLLLLKSNLVRDKNYSDEQAIELIDEIKKYKDFSEIQVQDEGYLPENARPSLYDLFGDRKLTELLGPLVR